MAGPGRCQQEESGEFYDGSPLLALNYPFTHHVYVEIDEAAAAALNERCEPWRRRGRHVTVIQGDCNRHIGDVIAALPRNGLTFAFLDPTNWQVRFSSIRRLTDKRRVDLLVTFMAGMMKRVHSGGRELDAFFGTTAWKSDPRYQGSTGKPTLSGLLACYREQLATIGYQDRLAAREIPVVNSRNAIMYLMAFFSKHPLGYEFWDRITTEDQDGQLALTWEPRGHDRRRVVVPRSAVELPALSLWRPAAPLLEEESDVLVKGTISEVAHPRGIDRAMSGAGLPADNQPVDRG
jgi:three-Cys-motif partner protein